MNILLSGLHVLEWEGLCIYRYVRVPCEWMCAEEEAQQT